MSVKDKLLGMPHGTANNRLRKMLLWQLVVETGRDSCFQCGQKIEDVDDLSIEHKQSWQGARDPKAAFFDLENIAFSHLRCNIGAGTHLARLTSEEKKQRRSEYDKGPGRDGRNRRHIAWQKRNPEKHNANSRAWYKRRGRAQRQKVDEDS